MILSKGKAGYRIKRVMEVYGDAPAEARRNLHRSDQARAAFYRHIFRPDSQASSGNLWRSPAGQRLYTYDTDVVGARGAGIRPMLLLRGRARQHDDVDAADGLELALELVFPKG